ncbi:MAG: zinc-ribbon domain-containing protein, partial [Gammaproteobacteria bacterium]|nr:zinc-ribbon domain-containing protein [Gammaproteobacteria bacterium]
MQTICPHCQTVFKVSDEQLSLADGYVRCGICKEVFNALEKPTAEAEKDPSADSAIADKTDTTKTVAAGDSNTPEPAAHPTTTLPDSEKNPEPPGDSAATSTTAAEQAKEFDVVVDNAQADLFSEASPETETESPSFSTEISAPEAIEPDTVADTVTDTP